MSAVIRDIRAFQSAVRFKDRPNVYRSVVRDIVAEQREGLNGMRAVYNAKNAQRTDPKPLPDGPEVA